MKQSRNLYKLLAEEKQKRIKYFQDYLGYGQKIKKVAQKLLPDAKVLIFGSTARGESAPDSDIDILIVSDFTPQSIFEQAKIKTEIEKHFRDNPFELHLVTPKDYQNWYRKFIKKDFVKV